MCRFKSLPQAIVGLAVLNEGVHSKTGSDLASRLCRLLPHVLHKTSYLRSTRPDPTTVTLVDLCLLGPIHVVVFTRLIDLVLHESIALGVVHVFILIEMHTLLIRSACVCS
jgi:hypothetical protein